MNGSIITALTVAALVTAPVIYGLRKLAPRLGLLDVARGHKMHIGAVPLVGGLGMLVGLMAALTVLPDGLGNLPVFMTGAVLLVLTGALDDRFDLPARVRILVHVAVATLVVMTSSHGVRLETLGDFLGTGPVHLGLASVPVTVFVMVAAINAFNMLDGLDGLAGGVSLVASLGLLCFPMGALPPGLVPVVAALAGATLAFLVFNAPVRWNRPVRTFMGDAGSTLIGYTLAVVILAASQGPSRIAAPINTVWILFVPATDLIQCFSRRIAAGRSPFSADRHHLHHELRDAGWTVTAIFSVYAVLSVVAGAVGILLERTHAPEWLSFLMLLGGAAAFTAYARHLAARNQGRLLHDEHHSRLADGHGDVPGFIPAPQTSAPALKVMTFHDELPRPTRLVPPVVDLPHQEDEEVA